MKFKTIAAATLAVATMLGMGACGSSAGAKAPVPKTIRPLRSGITQQLVTASSIGRIWPKRLRRRLVSRFRFRPSRTRISKAS